MLNFTPIKSSRVHLQGKRTRHQKFAKQLTSREKLGHAALLNVQYLVFDRDQEQENILAANNRSGLKDKTNRQCETTG